MKSIRAINIGITTRCNYTCGFCWGRHLPQGDLPLADLDRLLDLFPNARHLDLTGEGEPFLHRELFEMLRRGRARGLAMGLCTNGSLLGQVEPDELLDAGLEILGISIDSVDPVKFARIRGGRLDQVKRGIARLTARRRARDLSSPALRLVVTVLRDEIPGLEGIIALYQELGLDGGVSCQGLNRMPGYAQWYSEDLRRQMLSSEEERDLLQGLRARPEIRQTGRGRDFDDFINDGFDWASAACPWLEHGIFVRHDGWVAPCCLVKDTAHALGLLGHSTWEEMWRIRESMRRALQAGVVPAACEECGTAEHAVANAGRRRAAAVAESHGGSDALSGTDPPAPEPPSEWPPTLDAATDTPLPAALDSALGSGVPLPMMAFQLLTRDLDHAATLARLRLWREPLRLAGAGPKLARIEELIAFVEALRERWSLVADFARRHDGYLPRIAAEGPAAAGRLFTHLVAIDECASVAAYGFGDEVLLGQATEEVVAFLEAQGLLTPSCRLLDLGCGTGRLLAACASRLDQAVGVDASSGMIEVARRRLQAVRNVRVQLVDGVSLHALADAGFDVVVALDSWPYVVMAGRSVVEHLMKEVARVLVPGGEFAILNYSYQGDLDGNIREVRDLAAALGFAVVAEAVRPFRLWDGIVWRLRRA